MILNACQKYKTANMVWLTELEDQGWTIDRWGNAKITTSNGIKRRLKFQHHTIRVEQRFGKTSWMRIRTLKYDS